MREGRRREFAKFTAFADPRQRERIPDPNDEHTYLASWPGEASLADPEQLGWLSRTHALLALRHTHIVPRLAGALARWRLNDGCILTLVLNLGAQPVALPTALAGDPADLLYESREGVATALAAHHMPARACVALLHTPSPM